eukprot:CAMPEP_0119326924 /NCGR_PEP_ID=MMETSP1333-20130426/69588_1 /TAXON_ID=418940 /ORGANISM="Scyphosphaera apsteinii, Strain RCC1455" /LENGTH=353 /DNA_ID=CAMNT_0007335363 /DNA_START=139 /DNA_END=1200 /DNA_ORIENTATION=-
MAVGLEAKRAKTARGRRILAKREPKLIENPRTALIVRGQRTSAIVNSVLTDLYMLKKPYSIHFKRHNAVHPFEDVTPLEFLAQKNDASLFAFGTHSKKRPNHLVLGRMFDHHLLDMFELAIQQVKTMHEFAKAAPGGASIESKPCVLFQGEWDNFSTLRSLRSLLLDFFHGQVVSAISPIGIERIVSFTAVPSSRDNETRVLMRHYVVKLKKSAEGTSPYTELTEIGPSLDLQVRRVQQPSDDLLKSAMFHRSVTPSQPKKTKNVSHSRVGGRQGRIHVPKQDLREVALARMKGLKQTPLKDTPMPAAADATAQPSIDPSPIRPKAGRRGEAVVERDDSSDGHHKKRSKKVAT